jgi:hypothetical protein
MLDWLDETPGRIRGPARIRPAMTIPPLAYPNAAN